MHISLTKPQPPLAASPFHGAKLATQQSHAALATPSGGASGGGASAAGGPSGPPAGGPTSSAPQPGRPKALAGAAASGSGGAPLDTATYSAALGAGPGGSALAGTMVNLMV